MMRLYILIKITQKIIILYYIILNLQIGILLMEIFFNATQLDFVPRIFRIRQMNQRYGEFKIFQTLNQQIECDEISLVKIGNKSVPLRPTA